MVRDIYGSYVLLKSNTDLPVQLFIIIIITMNGHFTFY